jgi:quercetin dioxygenase-like cupin family protein
MGATHLAFPDLTKEIEIPAKGILSRTLLNDDHVRIVLFGFAPGEELSEHTAAVPAIIHLLEGEANVRLGDEHIDARAGFLAHMPARLAHGLVAKTKVTMLLTMIKQSAK